MTGRAGEPEGDPAATSERLPPDGTLRALLLGATGSLVHQFARYLVVGGLAFAIDLGSLYVLTEFVGIHYLISAAVAFLFGLATNYLLSRIWVFDRRTMENSAVEFAIFTVIGVVGLGFNEGIIWFVREKIHLHYLVAKSISAGIVLFWNFGARRWLLFSDRPMPRFLVRLLPPYGTSPLCSVCVAAACLTFCLAVQGFTGSWHVEFTGYPDEPSHFVGAVMVRDWLVSGQWFTPFAFAQHYYEHYPCFAIGYWPPLFSVVTALWLLVAGVGRIQALVIPAVFAAGTGWLIFQFLRQRVGIAASVCAAALYLSLPSVRQWMCAVMVDHMTTFLCIATAVCLLRYLKQPVFWNGMLVAVSCGCAILSKYSAAYTAVLPFMAVLLLRRFELLRRPSFLVQPVVVALMVGPWALWVGKLAFYGLPSGRVALKATRAPSFVLAAFGVFPPALMAVVVLGLIMLLLRPAAWRDDLTVLSLLCAGHLALPLLTSVGPEQRYLLVPAAVLLVASFVGWSELLALLSPDGRWGSVVSVSVAGLTMVFVVSQLVAFARIPQTNISEVVAFIVNNPARAAQRVMVPPSLEGPVIAEFVAQSRQRPDHYLLRPGKVLAHSDWFGRKYSSTFSTPEEMMEYFQRRPVNLIIWNERPQATLTAHARLMNEMLQRYPLAWHKVLSLASRGGSTSSWTIYEYDIRPQTR